MRPTRSARRLLRVSTVTSPSTSASRGSTRGTAYRDQERHFGLRSALLTGAGVAAATLLVHLYDPNQPGSYGFCPLRETTGLLCPLCGGTRAVHALTHGDWNLAMGLNPVVVLLLPVGAMWWLAWVVRSLRGRRTVFFERLGVFWTVVVALICFAVLRNLPALQPYLSPFT